VLDFRPHEYALLMPAMSEQEYADLKASIAENGLIDDIVLCDGLILEGVHRDKACRELGMDISTRYENWDDFPESIKKIGPLAYAVAKNLPRRHLTIEQRVKLALELLPLLKKEAQERQKATQFRDGGDRCVSSETDRKGRATEIAAEMVGVSTSTVERAVRAEREKRDGVPTTEQPPEPDVELYCREAANDVRDMITKVLRHTDWTYKQRAWLCSKAGSKLAALARELSKCDNGRATTTDATLPTRCDTDGNLTT
jgi:hypothetical protein